MTLALIMASSLYERLTTSVFKALIKPKSTIVDLGAGFGYYTLLAAKLVDGEGRVYAFEPEPTRYRFLLWNIKVNNFTNISAINKAVTNKSGRASFFIRGERSSLSGLQDYERKIEVETISLDDFFEGREHEIDLIKMDIEGAEMSALSGMKNILNINRHLVPITEFAPNLLEANGVDPREFIEELLKYDFKIYIIDDSKLEIRHANVVDLIKVWENRLSINLLCIRVK